MQALAGASTGNNTHAAISVGSRYSAVAFLFENIVDAGNGTVDYKVQGSIDGLRWDDIAYHVAANNTLAVAAITVVDLNHSVIFLHNPDSRKYRFFRLVTTNNTDATYRAFVETFPM